MERQPTPHNIRTTHLRLSVPGSLARHWDAGYPVARPCPAGCLALRREIERHKMVVS